MNLDGSDQQPTAQPPNPAPVPGYEYFNYSPDGSKVMMDYANDESTQFRTTWTMNPDGSNYVRFPQTESMERIRRTERELCIRAASSTAQIISRDLMLSAIQSSI
jgi:hypothetical protein